MKTEEDEAFDDLARRQGMWGGGFQAKRAMAADKQEPWNEDEWRRNNWRCGHGWLRGEQCEICNAPQPAQEPFGWYSAQEDEFMPHKIRKEHERLNSYTHINGKFDLPLYTAAAQPAQEPVGMLHIERLDKWLDASLKERKQREWVGLTDDALADLWYKESLDWMEFARAHEAALKEKNNGA
jgi:hypothetical protein